MRNLKLTLSYDGTNYHGWQIQPNMRTVQGEIQNAISEIFKENITVFGSSRTDAGVHAKKYVCNFSTESRIPCENVPAALNTKLEKDIRVLLCEEESEDFHARKSAKNKTYRYVITSKYDVFNRFFEWYYPFKLDVKSMEKASKHFVGTHDFMAFMTSGSTFDTTVKTINYVNFNVEDDKIIIDINGNGFLYNMVRIIVGTLVLVGLGKLKEDDIDRVLESRDRKNAGITAPPEGLSLIEVNY